MEAPEFYQAAAAAAASAGFCSQFANEKHQYANLDSKPSGGGGVTGDHFIVEDLLDFSNADASVVTDAHHGGAFDTVTGNSADSSTVTVVDSCNSSSFSGCEPRFNCDIGSRNLADAHFCNDLPVPYDDLAELEWLSNFVEESFSSEDLQKLQLISGIKARPDESSETRDFQPDCNGNNNDNTAYNNFANIETNNNINNTNDIESNYNNNNNIFHPDMSVPAKARSKRSRAAPGNWASRLLVLSPTTLSSEPDIIIGPAQQPNSAKKPIKPTAPKKRSNGDGNALNGEARKCLHCATDKTPQWRTGPMGPKTLCNACGVRYKSGRLVPEYRPAASPTFMLTKHSNSHRKVLELRRQKELIRAQQQQQQQFLHHHHQNMIFDVSNGGDDFLIHQHVGTDFRQLI